MTDQDILQGGYAVDDPKKRQAFLDSIDRNNHSETLPPARIFEIGSIIQKKKKEAQARGTTHSDYLSTRELLEAFDDAGVRPATFVELLVYSKKYWKPKHDPNNPRTKEEIAEHANAHSISAFGSVFSDSDGDRYVPCLRWAGSKRTLIANLSASFWDKSLRFLVFRKESL